MIEQQEAPKTKVIEHKIQKYHNRQTKPLSAKRTQIVTVGKSSVIISYADSQEIQDNIEYDRISKVSNFKLKKQSCDVIALTLKNDSKPMISFRVLSEEAALEVQNAIQAKVNEINNLPDYTDLLAREEELVTRIQETEPEYKEIYSAFQNKIDRKILKVCIFYDHKDIVEFHRLARVRGYEKQKGFLLTKLRSEVIVDPQSSEIFPKENYDIFKSLQGIRLQDDQKKLKYVPTNQENDDQLYFSSIPDPKEESIIDQFEPIEDKMEIEYEGNKQIRLQSDVRMVGPINLPKPDKNRYRISQNKEIFEIFPKNDKKKEQKPDLNVKMAKKVALTLRLFYKLIQYSPSLSEVTSIEEQLNRLLNSEPRPASYLQGPIKKTIQTILRWKRDHPN